MKLTFAYDVEKEFINLQNGLKTQHNPEHQPKLVREMMAAEIDVSNKDAVIDFISAKIETEQIDIQSTVTELQEKWALIEADVVSRLDKVFGDPGAFDGIIVYLSLNGRCSYNFSEHYFFVQIGSIHPVGTIIHELMHFYTHKLIQPMFEKKNLMVDFPAYKEALTILLNHEFADLIEEPDKGYEKHVELRKWIETYWHNPFDSVGTLTDHFLDYSK